MALNWSIGDDLVFSDTRSSGKFPNHVFVLHKDPGKRNVFHEAGDARGKHSGSHVIIRAGRACHPKPLPTPTPRQRW